MFGHQDDKKHDDESERDENVVKPDESAETVTAGAPEQPAEDSAEAAPTADVPAPDEPQSDDDAWQHPGAPIPDDDATADEDDHEKPEPIKDIVGESAGPSFKPLSEDEEEAEDVPQSTPHDLIDIKQKALTELRPLTDKLDQSPEDKFRTTMMIIQASDDQSLLSVAYDAAHDIKDDKVRAQALLDVVNEINYFTQHPEQ
jgi:hypothetical protein